jgi:fructokinase
MNLEELHLIRSILGLSGNDRACINYLMQHYGIEMLSLTKGKEGSELFTATGSYQLRNEPIRLTGDTVGAGDAYAAILALGYLRNWHPERILKKATELAERVCTLKGAIPKTADFYDDMFAKEDQNEH